MKMSREVYHSKHYQSLEDVHQYRKVADVKYLLMSAEQAMKKAGYTPTQVKTYSAFFSLQFLTAGRLSEVYDIKLKNIYVKKESGQWFLFVLMPNRKSRKTTKKISLIWIDNPAERLFVNRVMSYIKYRYNILEISKDKHNKVMQKKLPEIASVIGEELLFINPTPKIHKKLYRMLLTKQYNQFFKINTHFVRSLRASILVNQYNFSSKELQKFLGHTTIVSSEPYINLDINKIKYKLVSANVI